MELVNILIAIFTFCILVISLLLFLKREKNNKLKNIIPSPAPAQSILSNSWASVENFINQGENNVDNSVQSAQEGVEFNTVDADKSKVHKIPILVDSLMEYEKAFDNYILKDPSELELPLDSSSDSLIVQTSEVIETPPKSTTELVELEDNHLDRENAISKVHEIVKEQVLNSIQQLKINEKDVVENFENKEESDEEYNIDTLLDFVKKTANNVVDKAKPIIEKVSAELFEGFSNKSEYFFNEVHKITENFVSKEVEKLSSFKADKFKSLLKVLELKLNEL